MSINLIGIYPDSCVQNESRKVLIIANNLNYNNVGQNDCICWYYSFEAALKDLDNNTYVNLTISFATVSSPVSASNLNNVTISGHAFPTVDCNNTGSLLCEHCNNFIIDNIKWRKCGYFNNNPFNLADSGTHHSNGARGLYFVSCTNIIIRLSTFIESLVTVFQASGVIKTECVKFLDISENLNANDTNIDTQSYNYNGLLIDQNISTPLKIFIINCLFSNTPGSASVQLLIVKAKIASMQINDTAFVNISIKPLPSIYFNSIIYIDIIAEESNVTFYNVTFHFNNVRNILSVFMNENASTIQLHSCVFFNNTASKLAVLTTRNLTITDSRFQWNDVKANLISTSSQTSDFNRLTISNNFGGPLLSLNSCNISANFKDSHVQGNTLVSGHGLIVVTDYYELDVSLADIQFISNNVSTEGSAFYCSNSIVKPLDQLNLQGSTEGRANSSLLPTHKLVLQNVQVLMQYGSGHGAGVYISLSQQSYDSCSSSYTIKQCTFGSINNIKSVIYYSASEDSQYNAHLLIQNCTFKNNFGTALYLVNSNLMFEDGYTLFENNTAEHGAAMYLDLNSSITFDVNSMVLFHRNEARKYGGAIFCSVSMNGNCYKNVSDILLVLNNSGMIKFSDNAANIWGDSIYFSVEESCDEDFLSASNITLHPFGKEMVTSPKELKLDPPAVLLNYTNVTGLNDIYSVYPTYLIPNIMLGQNITIPSCLLDYNQKPGGIAPFLISQVDITHKRYFINSSRGLSIGCHSFQGINNLQIVGNLSSDDNLSRNFFYIIDNSVLRKYVSDNDYITIQVYSSYDAIYALKPTEVYLIIEISAKCHAGFHYIQEENKCICYTTDGIISCTGSNADITRGYWFGTVNEQTTVVVCPVSYCKFDRCEGATAMCPLLPSPDDQCGDHRVGIACGKCEDGYTLSFDSVDCVNINDCTTGQLILIVSMTCLYWILTVTVVFAVMHFKVGIGYFYGIMFYYSIIDILSGQVLLNSNALYRTVTVLSSLARLTPQFLGQLCFVRGLSGIDQQYIHYIHPLAILFLLLLISISARFSPRLSLFVGRGVIHVICFLLLLSYTSIASASLLLMRPLTFAGINKIYTYLSPDIEYFHGRHLVYGLVAIVCGLVIVIGLPLLLLLEPFLNSKVNFSRIKPLLDQFQGHYKDKYRYFASYYMICRLVLLIIVNANINNIFTVAYLQLGALVVMALIHFIVRPYANKILNYADGFLLLIAIMVAMLQPIEASSRFAANTVIGLSFFFVLLPLFTYTVLIIPYVNKENIKKIMKFVVSSVIKSPKTAEPANRGIELQPVSQDVYQVTVDEELRDSTATTIV